ncbi:MAG: helix-turn-helix domain-containing protein [Thermoguttaceae bacterium]
MSGWTRLDNTVIERLPEIGLTSFAVYVVIAKHTNGDGIAWPSVPTIARLTGTSIRTVRRAITNLQATGLLRVDRQQDKNGRSLPSNYILPAVGEGDKTAPPVVLSCQGEGDKNDPGRVSPQHPEQDLIEQDTVNKADSAPAKRFCKPTIEDVQSYCRERGNGIDAQRWIDYYQANGWRVGKNPMRDWKAAIRTWERNGFSSGNDQPTKPEPLKYRA